MLSVTCWNFGSCLFYFETDTGSFALYVNAFFLQFGDKAQKYKMKVANGQVMVRIGCSYEPLSVFIEKVDPCRGQYFCKWVKFIWIRECY